MGSYLDLQFQWYNNGIKNIKPSGLISLRQFIGSVMNPKPELRQAFIEIQKAAQNGDKKLKDELKTKHLFFTTPSVIVDPIRNYDSIKSFLPLCVIEYDDVFYPDGVEGCAAEDLRDYIFEKQKSCIFAFTSPSKTGCKFIFLIKKPENIEGYKSLFCGIAYELDKFKGLDMSTLRITQPLFSSWDENAKFREDAVPFTKRGYKTNAFDAEKEINFDIPQEVDEAVEKKVVDRILYLIDKIVDNAHPQLLGISFLVAGWSAANYIHQELAYDTLMEAITNNEYMSKNTKGYSLTAKQMFNKGLNFPAEFK